MTDQMREALETIAAYPSSRDQEMGMAAMRKIAQEAIASAQQADHIGDVSEMVAAPVVPEEWRQAIECERCTGPQEAGRPADGDGSRQFPLHDPA